MDIDVKKEINRTLKGLGRDKEGHGPNNRGHSFDYCYNYFYSFRNNPIELASEQNMQISCLQLGFYLASWGMMRGSSFLLMKSVRNYTGLIRVISKMDPRLWSIDIPNYTNENIGLLLDCRKKIIDVLGKENKPSDTLVTKIMLGVFANVPAYDGYFKKFLKRIGARQSFSKKSLEDIKNFYDFKKEDFDSEIFKIPTHDFLTTKDTNIFYTKAKLVDMCGFANGQ